MADDAMQSGFESITSQLMQNPELFAALSRQLGTLVGVTSGLVESLPEPVKRRLLALKKIQRDHLKVELEYYAAIARIDEEFSTRFQELYDKRTQIVTGAHEPGDDELDHAPLLPTGGENGDDDDDDDDDGDESDGEEQNEPHTSKASEAQENKGGNGEESPSPQEETSESAAEQVEVTKEDTNVKGIPDFWLTALSNHELIAELIQEHDQEPLSYLEDIQCRLLGNNSGFELNFVFSENPFFTNRELRKTYHLDHNQSADEELVYMGPIFQKTVGTQIQWKNGKDVTVKVIKKKQRKSRGNNPGQTRTVNKEIARPSFFNFFSPPTVDEEEDSPEVIQTATQLLTQDYEIAGIIQNSIIPKAVLWFTGEALEYEDMGGEEEEEEEEEEDDGVDDDDDGEAGTQFKALHAAKHTNDGDGEDDGDDDDKQPASGSGRRKQKSPRKLTPNRSNDRLEGEEDDDEEDDKDEDWKPPAEQPPECKQS
eukprot:gene2187-5203_t